MKVLIGICAALALGLAIVGYQWRQAQERLGEYTLALEHAERIAKDSERAFDTVLRSRDDQIAALKDARLASEQAALASMQREEEARNAAEAARRALLEEIERDEQGSAWGAVRVPDAVIDGLRGAAGVTGTGANR